jgi:hypothetical protein
MTNQTVTLFEIHVVTDNQISVGRYIVYGQVSHLLEGKPTPQLDEAIRLADNPNGFFEDTNVTQGICRVEVIPHDHQVAQDLMNYWRVASVLDLVSCQAIQTKYGVGEQPLETRYMQPEEGKDLLLQLMKAQLRTGLPVRYVVTGEENRATVFKVNPTPEEIAKIEDDIHGLRKEGSLTISNHALYLQLTHKY